MQCVDLSPEQEAVADRIRSFIDYPKRHGRYFVLHGLAGTGKTVLLAAIARENPGFPLVTLTGKAASVLTRKTGVTATTIHQAIYRLVSDKASPDPHPVSVFDDNELDEGAAWRPTPILPNTAIDKKRNLAFVRKHGEGSLTKVVFLLDELSMVPESIATDILATGARIVACGDPGQLPPVMGKQYFTLPDAVLNEVHRQAWDSPIIRQAHAVRNSGAYVADGDDFQVVKFVPADMLLSADIVLAWRNDTRRRLNHLIRSHHGVGHLPPQKGEPVMCLMNRREPDEPPLYNGAVYQLAEDYVPHSNRIKVLADDELVTIDGTFFEDVDNAGHAITRDVTPFTHARAATVHKYQGSEADRIILVDEYDRSDGRAQWLYTGITRAAKRLIVQRDWGW